VPATYVGGKTVAIAGTTSTTAISLTDLTGGIGSAPIENDIVIVAFGVGSSVDEAPGVTTSGYTEEQELFSDSSDDTNLSVSWKFMGSTPDTSVTVSGTGNTANAGAVAIQVWRGINLATPFDVAETTATGTATDRPDPPAITPTTADAMVIAIGAGAAGAGGLFTSSDLSNFITATSPGTKDCSIGMGSFAWSSGEFNPAQFGGGAGGGAARSWAAVTLALRPNPVLARTGTSEGVASTNGESAAISPRESSSSGVASVSGSSAAVSERTGTSGGVGAAVGQSAALFPVTGDAPGSASLYGEARMVLIVSGDIAGAASIFGEARAIWPRTVAIAGVAEVIGESDHLFLALASADRVIFLGHDGVNFVAIDHDGVNSVSLGHDGSNIVNI
jgi:hypothetical protein